MNTKTVTMSKKGFLSDETKELVREFDEFLRVAGAPSPPKKSNRSIVLRAGLLRTKGLKFSREDANE